MSIDNTHTKYLKGHDKKVWNNFKSAYEAQNKLASFLDAFSSFGDDMGDEEEIEIAPNVNPTHRIKKVKE